jgi:hypothetical protein
MSLISVLLVLVVIGVCLYLVETYLPISPPIKVVNRVIVVIALILWLLQLFVGDIRVPRVGR